MDLAAQIGATRTGAGVAARPEVRTLRLSGPDRLRFLNGMVTNDVSKLSPGEGLIAVKTNNRGRIEGLMRVRCAEDALLLDLLEAAAEKVLTVLDMFIIMDDCQIEDISDSREVVTVLGPSAAVIVAAAGLGDHAGLTANCFASSDTGAAVADLSLGLRGLELHVPAGRGPALIDALVAAGAAACDAAAFDILRIEAGVPIDGRDLDDETIPMEARLEAAISTEKGCYVGQEVIARATIQGQVAYLLVGLHLDGDGLPPEGADLVEPGADKVYGELCSVVVSPSLQRTIGLAYVHRKREAVGTTLEVHADGSTWAATVVALPFV